MARRPRVDLNADGSASIRVSIPPHTWRLITKYADKLKLDEEAAMRVFLGQIEALISEGSAAWLSTDWQRVLRDAQQGLPPEFGGVDLTLLHRGERTKSGFVGVYANGAGFRATGRRGEYLGTYRTAEEAAARRYLHYKQHGLPYGELELAIDELRKQGETGMDEALRDIVLETARLTGTSHLYGGGEEAGLKLAGFGPEGPPEPIALDKMRARLRAGNALLPEETE